MVFVWFAFNHAALGQDYHAVQGSNYSGALGVHNNPASIVNVPYPWDITVIGIQSKYSTNAIKIIDYSLLGSPVNSKFQILGGNFRRFAHQQTNINLVNTRIAIDQRKAVAFGVNFKTFGNSSTSVYNFRDSIQTFNSFLSINEESESFNVELRGSSIIEFYGAYAQTVLENTDMRLNAGLTLKLNRGIAGGRADIIDIEHRRRESGGYDVAGGDFLYGYSSNLNEWAENGDGSSNPGKLLENTRTGFSFDAGLEIVLKPGGDPGVMDDEESYYDYDWKIGASLIDAGWAKYNYGSQSKIGKMPSEGVTGSILDSKLNTAFGSLTQLNDSISTFTTLDPLGGDFHVFHPGRLVLNADRYLFDAFYLNGEISLNVGGVLGKQRLYLRNMNLFRLTPRWETRRWGIYLPMLLNNENQFWVGAGFKAGPLLIGFHNLGNIFSKDKMANGGGYITLNIRPGKKVTGSKGSRFLDCPPPP